MKKSYLLPLIIFFSSCSSGGVVDKIIPTKEHENLNAYFSQINNDSCFNIIYKKLSSSDYSSDSILKNIDLGCIMTTVDKSLQVKNVKEMQRESHLISFVLFNHRIDSFINIDSPQLRKEVIYGNYCLRDSSIQIIKDMDQVFLSVTANIDDCVGRNCVTTVNFLFDVTRSSEIISYMYIDDYFFNQYSIADINCDKNLDIIRTINHPSTDSLILNNKLVKTMNNPESDSLLSETFALTFKPNGRIDTLKDSKGKAYQIILRIESSFLDYNDSAKCFEIYRHWIN